MTDTDLFTVGESTDGDQLSKAVTTDTPDVKSASKGSLSTLVLPELRALASQAGVKGTSGMRKNELIAAIKEIRGQANGTSVSDRPATPNAGDDTKTEAAGAETSTAQGKQDDSATEAPRRERRGASREAGSAGRGGDEAESSDARHGGDGRGRNGTPRGEGDDRPARRQDNKSDDRGSDNDQGGDQQNSGGQQNRGGSNQQDDEGDGRQGRRGRRFRDRRRRGERSGDGGGGGDTELREDDVVQPVAGILDVLDNYAFVRTSGYLAGPHDVYVSMNMVRKNGLRRGDAVTGAVRVPREGEQPNQRQKFNPLVRLDTINGGSIEDAKKRPDFSKLTPLYPNQRLRLETTPDRLTTRVIDLIMPIGKGQRALIVSPPKAGKTTILQDIANAITKNNPECHLMVVLVDERPEEVTDMTRSVKGEVIASTFDRPPTDHTAVAELAIERAKRLVEQGKDVVVLLDSITRLGRAYNNASPASGRILSGGVDSTALYPPKRFLGAARNIEEGGSLTIIATAMVETGSTGDTVIFEEFKGTGNAELKLDRKISERRVFPAVDVNPSGTRKDELLLSPDEFGIVHKLRRVLSGLDSHQAIDLLMSQLRKTKTNYEFLVQVSKTTPGSMDND
ncbi:transcription termination factor Rho [Mycobacterium shigaense]|uniref:Transcription termination factor Rho n=1 Tax=Mycobacterium shigaense TaxID=722731 RepID=A0A1Z4ELG5_9MYCO|nr:transcription termination factor Rho [Mycobacterium shigaense]MEA1121088.1 transcription termination factor Rho [Mycobacterium shigaense]PRI14559.1 transcription termination factor Rho [Mycobacterium shigaense]BAX93805.1 transcription termination factor Rho [Mycobacterium shigaense]